MKKKPSTLINMLFSLLLVSAIAGTCLGGVYLWTKDALDKVDQDKFENALKAVLPAFDRIEKDSVSIDVNGKASRIFCYATFNQDQYVGSAVESISPNGFSGNISLMVGFLADGSINSIKVLQHGETPGLGSKMTEPKFSGQFSGKHPEHFKLKVKKDQGDVDAITAATISSRAYSEAVAWAYQAFRQHRNQTDNKGGETYER